MSGFLIPNPISTLCAIPLIGIMFILLIRGDEKDVAKNVKYVALYASSFAFFIALYILMKFVPEEAGFQFVEQAMWLPALGLQYQMGIDGISLFFVVLSALLTPLCILASWHSIKTRVKEYMIAFLLLETFMIGTFTALDTVLFYIFFEAVLIPMFLIIGVWGGARRVYAAFKFFLYTLFGSVLMLVALLTIYVQTGSTDIMYLLEHPVASQFQIWLWLAFFASFAVKMPMWPVHTWLPAAHVQAPTAGSVILAGVLLKMGGYGFLRFSIPMMPEATAYFADMVFWLSVVAIIYTSLIALVQEDMKKLIAYSSVAHMGFVTLGLFTMTIQGMQGALFQMISHGIISAALFLIVGVLYDRLHTREIGRYGGLVQIMPKFATVFMIFMLASAGLPGTSGFVGEFLSLLGAFQVNVHVALFATTGIVLGAAYMLVLYRRVVFGPLDNEDAAKMPDLHVREIAIFAPLLALVFFLGVQPGFITDRTEASITRVQKLYEQGLERAGKTDAEIRASFLLNTETGF
jgi:NADH-quinone oxidoreductase subunit M